VERSSRLLCRTEFVNTRESGGCMYYTSVYMYICISVCSFYLSTAAACKENESL